MVMWGFIPGSKKSQEMIPNRSQFYLVQLWLYRNFESIDMHHYHKSEGDLDLTLGKTGFMVSCHGYATHCSISRNERDIMIPKSALAQPREKRERNL